MKKVVCLHKTPLNLNRKVVRIADRRKDREQERQAKGKSKVVYLTGKGKMLCVIALAAFNTACSTSMLSGHEVELKGSPEGIAALGDVFTGMQIVSKTDQQNLPANPHSALRQAQEQQKTLRIRFLNSDTTTEE